jgi:hypothetical protein
VLSESPLREYWHIRSNWKLFNLKILRAKHVLTVSMRKMLFANDAALCIHTKDALQLMDRFANAC